MKNGAEWDLGRENNAFLWRRPVRPSLLAFLKHSVALGSPCSFLCQLPISGLEPWLFSTSDYEPLKMPGLSVAATMPEICRTLPKLSASVREASAPLSGQEKGKICRVMVAFWKLASQAKLRLYVWERGSSASGSPVDWCADPTVGEPRDELKQCLHTHSTLLPETAAFSSWFPWFRPYVVDPLRLPSIGITFLVSLGTAVFFLHTHQPRIALRAMALSTFSALLPLAVQCLLPQ